ncbi:MAG TPA: DUF3987 domain-containing protein [Anaerohalosphaeraceae bacterium]|nr:DUF3987 domain-containing protein [Anaerohalosphaeraceae bacterium]
MKEQAIQYRNAGLSVLPANPQLKFATLPQWKQYQHRLPTEAEVQGWFNNGQSGLCIVTGAVSGNLEMIDFDLQAELFEAWYLRVQEAAPDVLPRLVIETSQSGGRHVIYRCSSAICGNLKLAQRKLGFSSGEEVVIGGKTYRPRQDKEGNWHVVLTLIETRGQGGLFLCAPTPGYTIIQGDLTNLPVLTAPERELLLEAAWSLNEYIPDPEATPQAVIPTDTLRPGDDYNARGDVRSLLQSHGWTCVKGGDNEYWRRPGKTVGWSATLKNNVFYVWSTNASPFESQKPYSPFSVYALLEHSGDFSKAAAELSRQGYGQKPEVHPTDVDLSGILASPDKPLPEDPGPIPESLFSVPGFIERLMKFCLDTAPYPNKALAFCGALALQSFLAGRKIKEPGGLRTNIYLLALASTGTGKDWPRKINANILNLINASNCLGNRFASGEGMQDVMLANLNMLFQTDEIDTMLRCINTSRESRYESIQDTLLTFYTSSDSSFPMRTKAGMKECVSIRNPHLTIFGTATPKNYYQALSERMMTSGFFSRMLIVDVGERALCEIAGDIDAIPPDILEVAEFWQEKTRPSAKHNLSWENPNPPVAPYQGQAGKLLFDFQRQSDLNHRAAEANDEVAKAVWSRAAENARKLALLYACSENHQQPVITEAAAQWAIDFVNHQVRRQLFMAGIYAAENKFHADCLKLKEKLRHAPGRKMQHSDLMKNMRMDKDTFKKLVDTMFEQGDIQIEPMVQVTKKGVFYKLCTA